VSNYKYPCVFGQGCRQRERPFRHDFENSTRTKEQKYRERWSKQEKKRAAGVSQPHARRPTHIQSGTAMARAQSPDFLRSAVPLDRLNCFGSLAMRVAWRLTFDMSGRRRLAGGGPLDGRVSRPRGRTRTPELSPSLRR
jgi:hypothetical protein